MENFKHKYEQLTFYPRKTTSKEQVALFSMLFVLSGIFGFIYEEIFYRIDLGEFVKRGTTLGPWIPIYGIGGILIFLLCFKDKRKPISVFIKSGVIAGLLELITGFLLFKIAGIRLWDYNVEILNFGNIGGYICLRSVLFFAVSGLILMYGLIPLIRLMMDKIGPKKFIPISNILGILFLSDAIITNVVKIIMSFI